MYKKHLNSAAKQCFLRQDLFCLKFIQLRSVPFFPDEVRTKLDVVFISTGRNYIKLGQKYSCSLFSKHMANILEEVFDELNSESETRGRDISFFCCWIHTILMKSLWRQFDVFIYRLLLTCHSTESLQILFEIEVISLCSITGPGLFWFYNSYKNIELEMTLFHMCAWLR